MDTTVAVAIIVALSTLGATFLQNWHSSRQFERQLKRTEEAERRQRQRDIRSEPLLKLRTELARICAKQDKLVSWAHKQHTRVGFTEEEAKRQFQEAIDDWNTYTSSEVYVQTLFVQFDLELVKRVEEILKDYTDSYVDAMFYKDIKATELGKAMQVFERNKIKIIELQSFINKRLDEL